MALKPCRECKTLVSSEAKICPNCGISKPIKGGSKLLWIIFGLIILFIIISPKNNTLENTMEHNQHKETIQASKLTETPDLKVELGVEMLNNNQKPIIRIKTNLPENTILMGSLANPINEGGTGYFSESHSSVNSRNIAEIGPFSNNGESLPSGFYMVKVSMGSLSQPKSVQSIIGNNGERLKGNNIFTLAGVPSRTLWQRFIFEIAPDGSIVNFQTSKNSDADYSLIPIE